MTVAAQNRRVQSNILSRDSHGAVSMTGRILRWTPCLGNAVIAIGSETSHLLHGAAGPDHLDVGRSSARPEAENNTIIMAREKTAAPGDPASQRFAALPNRETGADRIAIAPSTAQMNPQ